MGVDAQGAGTRNAYILKPLLKILGPLVSLIGLISNTLVKMIGVNPEKEIEE